MRGELKLNLDAVSVMYHESTGVASKVEIDRKSVV